MFSKSEQQIVIALAASMECPVYELLFTSEFQRILCGLRAACHRQVEEHDLMRFLLTMRDDGELS